MTSARAKLKSATPSPSASTSSVSGWPACRRSTIVSSPLPPSTVRRPWSSLGGWIFALAALARLSAPCAFVIPAPATAVATATETTAGQSTRVVRDFLGRMDCFMVSPLLLSLTSIGPKDTGRPDLFPAPRNIRGPAGVIQYVAAFRAPPDDARRPALPLVVLWR